MQKIRICLEYSAHRDIFSHSCSCPSDFDGMNCELPRCGGNVTSQETPQTLSVQPSAYEIDCTWNIDSPEESRIILDSFSGLMYKTIWSGGELIWFRGSPSYLEGKTIMSLTNQVTIQFSHFYSSMYYTVIDSVRYHHVFDGDECASNPCEGGATCTDSYFNYTCACANGTFGDRCQNVDYCYLENPCSTNSECSNDIYNMEAICVCHSGYGGETCQYPSVCNVMQNASDTKQYVIVELPHEGSCSVNFVAPSGREVLIVFEDVYLGYADDIIFPNGTRYYSKPASPVRSQGGNFTIRLESRSYFSETSLLIFYAIDIDECESSPCQNGATCMDELDGYTCQCTQQWLGANCTEFDNCFSNPCENGTCMDGDNTYTCSCFDGYKGTDCDEINPGCTNVTCQNGGSCLYINETHNAVCVCLDSFVGEFCEGATCGLPQVKSMAHHRVKRIVGGQEATPHSWPWQVSMRLGDHVLFGAGKHHCAASLLRNNMVVTAGHCKPSVGEKLHIGAHNVDKCAPEDGCHIVTITHAWVNQGYRSIEDGVPDNDVAMAKFEPPVMYDEKIAPLCLPEPQDKIPVGTICYAIGWGEGSNSKNLYQTHLERMSADVCKEEIKPGFLPEDIICAGHTDHNNRGTCHGDSGGPLLCQVPGQQNWKLFGITSWGRQCSTGINPNGFTNVKTYLPWIKRILDEN